MTPTLSCDLLRRAANFASAETFGPGRILGPGCGGAWYIYDPASSHERDCVAGHEEWLFPYLTVPAGGVFLDIGAYLGGHTVRVGRDHRCRVIAIEARPDYCRLLTANAHINDVHDVTVLCRALSARDGTVFLCDEIGCRDTPTNDPAGVSVACTTLDHELDQLRPRLERLDVIKLDVEGFEAKVLQGAKATIARYRPRIVVEVHEFLPGCQGHGEQILAWCGAMGYSSRRIFENTQDYYYLELNPALGPDSLWILLQKHAHPHDVPFADAWQRVYGTLYNTVRQLAPQTICEIGVRAGYSALTMLTACPQARLLGIDADLDPSVTDSHGGQFGMWRHAVEILPRERFQLLLANSRNLHRLPTVDLIYVDGDHSYAGCLADLRLASQSTRTILCDDVDGIADVRQACLRFCDEQGWQMQHIPNGSTGLALLTTSA